MTGPVVAQDPGTLEMELQHAGESGRNDLSHLLGNRSSAHL
ncbi:hypothetical protein JOF56_004355 [Kibdelosporangium banguiense]|uniref:Uncharacterized protein n=1 Tax=Kibdelosporangium banguiense TaxID=1365924 RepID=A0ABS4THR5_9PSEU|nr:hypothetical protein [Kibdelosporangium banguiense]